MGVKGRRQGPAAPKIVPEKVSPDIPKTGRMQFDFYIAISLLMYINLVKAGVKRDDQMHQDILNEIQTLRSSPKEAILNQAGNLAGIIGLVLSALPLL